MKFPSKRADTLARLRLVGIELFGNKWKAEMAQALGVSRPSVNNWDWEKHDPPADLDARLLAVLREEAERAGKVRGEMIAALERLVD